MIQQLIDRYKRLRTERFLAQTYHHSYAFVGMGQHSLTNLYPVIHHLGVPLKYICVTSERKARLIERKFPHVKATTSLSTILIDDDVKGIFVAAAPSAHFSIASQVLKSGKSLFIEKPPCQTLQELDALIEQQQLYGIPEHRSPIPEQSSPTRSHSRSHLPVAMVGLQKRYAPAVQILQKRLCKEHLISYDLHYLTGAYPEGNALLDLYIHPIDLVTYLFGKPEIIACQQIAPASYILMLRHTHIVGTLELSTLYSWRSAEEPLKVCTSKGIYRLSQMELLTFEPKTSSLLGVPFEKVHKHNKTIEQLYTRNTFTPTLPNNQIYSQGYYSEIHSFITSIELGHSNTLTDFTTIKPTYEVLMRIKDLFAKSS
ncbi:MAG: Gfo/Idh/MocA family oxidoreductase [Bacteroidaceae bacterium]|nr:Gfo/Idh/MocA family oxidoreductase [Bacteroidaceae bacterium]